MRFDRIGTEVSGYDYFVFRLWNTLTTQFWPSTIPRIAKNWPLGESSLRQRQIIWVEKK
jgi:hypothetical protein